MKCNLYYFNILFQFDFLGIHHGAGVELEKALGRELIWLPCRHHVFEIILKSVFEVYWPKQTGPNVPLFNRFKGSWNKIDKSKFKAGIEDTAVAQSLADITNEMLVFIQDYLQVRSKFFQIS